MDAGEALVGAQSGGGLERGLTVAEAHSEGQEPGWCCEAVPQGLEGSTGVSRPSRGGWPRVMEHFSRECLHVCLSMGHTVEPSRGQTIWAAGRRCMVGGEAQEHKRPQWSLTLKQREGF